MDYVNTRLSLYNEDITKNATTQNAYEMEEGKMFAQRSPSTATVKQIRAWMREQAHDCAGIYIDYQQHARFTEEGRAWTRLGV